MPNKTVKRIANSTEDDMSFSKKLISTKKQLLPKSCNNRNYDHCNPENKEGGACIF